MSSLGVTIHILGARRLVRRICKSCTVCRKAAALTEKQQMGQLPTSRVTASPPFSTTGLHFAGHFLIKKGHNRQTMIIKSYVCVFGCFSSKTGHLDLVSDLITEVFLAALRRFVSRCGLPTQIYSDNGTNFVGVYNVLKEMYTYWSDPSTQQILSAFTTTNRISLHFSPERVSAPHFGRIWEALVKAMKFHLHQILGEQCLTYEEMTTVICQVEACLNS